MRARPSAVRLLDATNGKVKVFEGNGGLRLIDSYRRGVGTMPAVEVVRAIAALWRALVAGDYERTYRVAGQLVPLASLRMTLDSYVAVEKHLLVRQKDVSVDRDSPPRRP